MPLITRSLKGTKLSIEEMDGNLLYLEGIATSALRDYVQLLNKPFVVDQFDRWNGTKELILTNKHLYIDGPFSVRFTNQVNEGGPNYLFRAWDWDGPSGYLSTPYQDQEVVYNERAQISFLMETAQRSSLSLKSFDWTAGTLSGVEFNYKYYQGALNLPINTKVPDVTDGSLAFSDGIIWNPGSTGTQSLNIKLNGQWKQVNLGPGVQGPTGPDGPAGPIGPTGPSLNISNPTSFGVLISDGTPNGVNSQSNLKLEGSTFSLIGNFTINGTLQASAINTPVISQPSISSATLIGNTKLQNIVTKLVDDVNITTPTINFDYIDGSVFYIAAPIGDFAANITNLPTDNRIGVNITIFVEQGLLPTILNDLQIDGVSKTVRWINGVEPTAAINGTTVYTFNLLRSNSTWVSVLGSCGSYF